MKIKLWQWEYDFDKDDAKIVVPLILLLLGLTLTHLRKDALLGGAVAYYLLYFFLKPCLLTLKELFARMRHWLLFRCPYCKSREVIFQDIRATIPMSSMLFIFATAAAKHPCSSTTG